MFEAPTFVPTYNQYADTPVPADHVKVWFGLPSVCPSGDVRCAEFALPADAIPGKTTHAMMSAATAPTAARFTLRILIVEPPLDVARYQNAQQKA